MKAEKEAGSRPSLFRGNSASKTLKKFWHARYPDPANRGHLPHQCSRAWTGISAWSCTSPKTQRRFPSAPTVKKPAFFLLHGGSGDFKGIERHSKLLASKFGFKVIAGTFPGRFYFPDASRDWPDDTIHPDGTVRTPIWKQGEAITPDQYDVVKDPSMRSRYGTRTLARAKPDTNFYYRMAAWPAAFEEGMVEANRRHFPEREFSVYAQGHSTGGPFICMLSQRIPNLAGVCATEHSPFGYLSMGRDEWGGDMGKISGYEKSEKKGKARTDPFNELYIRTWRDLARYQGPEALGQEGPAALMRLPAIMEDILEAWEKAKPRPQFKAEYIVTHAITGSLAEGARVTAARLQNEQRRNRGAGATLRRIRARAIRSERKTSAAVPVRDLQRQPRPQPRSL